MSTRKPNAEPPDGPTADPDELGRRAGTRPDRGPAATDARLGQAREVGNARDVPTDLRDDDVAPTAAEGERARQHELGREGRIERE